MARISLERTTGTGASTSETVALELQSRRAILGKEQSQWRDRGTQQVEQGRRRARDLDSELGQIDREMKRQETRIKSARDPLDRYEALGGEKKYVSESLIKAKRDEVTDQEIKLQTLRRQRGQVERDLAAAKMEEPAISLRSNAQVEQVSRQLSELKEGMENVEAKRESVSSSPMT